MSTAKQIVMNDLLNISDDVQNEFEVLEGLYKSIKLEKSIKSVINNGTLSSDEVRAYFSKKYKKNEVLACKCAGLTRHLRISMK